MGLLDILNDVGSRIRYGVSPEEKYRMLVENKVPGMPKPFTPEGEENPEATRYMSNYLGTKQWGATPTRAFNSFRNFIDPDENLYQQGRRGEQQALQEQDSYLADLLGE